MKPLVNRKTRPYRSQLRDEQAEATRERILEATGRVFAGGLAGVSIPAIAKEAGVSVPTIYRVFGSKRGLLEAIYPYAIRRARGGPLKVPTSFADFRDGVRILFDRLDSLSELDRAAIVSRGAEEVRHATMEARLAGSRQAVDGIAPGLPKEERDRIARLGIVLTQSASLRMLRDHLGLSMDQAIDDIEWMVRAAVTAARSEAST